MAEILIKPDEVPAGKIPVSVEGGCEWQDAPTGGGTPSSSVAEETDFGIMPIAGVLTTFSRGDHTHGSPADPVPAHEIAYNHGLLHSNSLDHSNALDHVAVHDNTQHSAAYQMVSEKAQANGYASLDATGKVPTLNLGGAGALGTNYLCGDQTWKTPAGGSDPFLAKLVLASDIVTGANVTPVSLTGMIFTFEANSKYVIDMYMMVSSAAATTGCGFQIDVSAAVTQIALTFLHQLANAGTLTGGSSIADDASVGVSSGVPTLNVIVPVYGGGLLITGANAGTAQFRFRSETTAVTTCKAGSMIRVMKMA